MITPASAIKARLDTGLSYRKLEKELGVSAGHLCRVVGGVAEAGPELLKALGLEQVTKVTYRKAKPRSKNG